MKKWLILVLVLGGVEVLFSQDKQFSILDLPFLKNKINRQIDISQHKSDYIDKAVTLKRNDGRKEIGLNTAKMMYQRKININAQDEFNKIGLDIVDINTKIFKDGSSSNYEDQTLLSDIVVIGEVVDKSYPIKDDIGYYSSYNKIKILQVFSDKWDILKDSEITIGSFVSVNADGSSSYLLGEPSMNLGEKYLIFAGLSRGYYYYAAEANQTEKLNNIIFDAGMALKLDNDKIHNFEAANKQDNNKDSQIIINRVKEILNVNVADDFFINDFK